MSYLDSFLAESLDAWRDVRDGLIDEVENIPADKFDFRPAPEVKSVKEMVQHILEVALFMTGELTRPDTNLTRAPWPELLAMYAGAAYEANTKAELLALLRSQMDDAEQAFLELGDLGTLQFIERFDGQHGTKMQWLHHGIAQEMYHRGQLVTYARLMGLEPALTTKIKKLTSI